MMGENSATNFECQGERHKISSSAMVKEKIEPNLPKTAHLLEAT
jgi:hypothetical protein